MSRIALFTDLDGTLLNSRSKISKENLAALYKLNDTDIVRIAITGRNLYSATKVLPKDAPLDYLVFSSGAGVYNWATRHIIYQQNLNPRTTKELIDFLLKKNVTFTIHKAIPLTHHFYYVLRDEPEDFRQRLEYYKEFAEEYKGQRIKVSTCIILMLSPKLKEFQKIKDEIKNKFGRSVSIIRTTSPINHKNIWIELYDPMVSKGHTARWIANYLSIDPQNTVGIGNDYNDIELLEYVNYPYVVENAPSELKEKYTPIDHHDNDAIAKLITKLF